MLFVTLGTAMEGTLKERSAKRLNWQYPEGAKLIAEYWPQGGPYDVVAIVEADSVGPMMAATAEWDGLFEFITTPAVTAEEGIKFIKQMQSMA